MSKAQSSTNPMPPISDVMPGRCDDDASWTEDRSMLSVIDEANDVAVRRGLDLAAQHAFVVDVVMRLEPGLKASVVDRLVSALLDTGERT